MGLFGSPPSDQIDTSSFIVSCFQWPDQPSRGGLCSLVTGLHLDRCGLLGPLRASCSFCLKTDIQRAHPVCSATYSTCVVPSSCPNTLWSRRHFTVEDAGAQWGALTRPGSICKLCYFQGISLPRKEHKLHTGGRKSQCPRSRTASTSVKDTIVTGSTFKRNKPGKTEFCKGAAHPVWFTLGSRIRTLRIS